MYRIVMYGFLMPKPIGSVRIATGTRTHEVWKVTEVVTHRPNGGCKVRALNPHTGRVNTLWTWGDMLRLGR